MKITKSRSTKLFAIVLAATFALSPASGLAKPALKLVAPVVDPDAGDTMPFEKIPGVLRSAKEWGLPPTVCFKHESEIDSSFGTGAGNACSSDKFFAFACGKNSTKIRRNKSWFIDYSLRVKLLIQEMPDPEKGLAEAKYGKFDSAGMEAIEGGLPPQPFTFFLPLYSKEAIKFHDLEQRAKNPESADDEALQTKLDAGFQAAVKSDSGSKAEDVLKELKRTMAPDPKDSIEGSTAGTLDQQRDAVLAGMDHPSDDDSNFVRETFARMGAIIRGVTLDLDSGAKVCFPGQHNTVYDRDTNKIIICPATLLSGTKAELAGSIATAMSHSIDSCAMDKLNAGSTAPGISLSGFLEPLRGCLAEKIARPKPGSGKNTLPEIKMPDGMAAIPMPETRKAAYNAALKTGGFRVQDGSPHCPAKFDSAELGRMTQFKGAKTPDEQKIMDSSKAQNIGQRDQSNDAVAQFFANKALARYIKNNETDHPDKKAELIGALTPYCDSFYNERGATAPAQDVLNKIIANDPDIAELVCSSAAGARGTSATQRAASEKLAKSYFDPKIPAPAEPKSCDAKLAKGAASYVRMFHNLKIWGAGNSLHFNPATVPENGIGLGAGAAVAPTGGENIPGGGTVTPGDAKPEGAKPEDTKPGDASKEGNGNSLPALSDYAPSETLGSQLATREQAIDLALAAEKDNCRNLVVNQQFPFASTSEFISDTRTCAGTGANRVDLNLFPAPHVVEAAAPGATGSKYKVQVGCQARCKCDPARCFFPEPVYLGMVGDPDARGEPNPVPNKNKDTVANDIAHYLKNDEPNGRYGIAAKECFKLAPPENGDVVTKGCSYSDPGLKDAAGRLKVKSASPVTLLGETSGALLTFGCEFHCNCGDPWKCEVFMTTPGIADNKVPPAVTADEAKALKSADAADIAKAHTGKPGVSQFTYLASVGITVPLRPAAVGKAPPATAEKGSVDIGGSSSGGNAGTPGSGDNSGTDGPGAAPSSVVITSWTGYGAADKPSDPPKPTEILASRNRARVQSNQEADDLCDKALTTESDAGKTPRPVPDSKNAKLTAEYLRAKNKDQFKYYCKDGAATPPREFPLEPIQAGTDTAKTKQISFQYKCFYSCSLKTRETLYAGEVPAAESAVALGTPQGREQARLADYALYRDKMDDSCKYAVTPTLATVGDANTAEIFKTSVRRKVTSSCSDAKKSKGPIDIQESVVYATNFPGDVSRAPLPYTCTYSCDCGTNTCSDGKAVLVKPKGDEDLRVATNLKKDPPGVLPIKEPTDKQVETYQRFATTKCLEQGKSVTSGEVSCSKTDQTGKGPDVFMSGTGEILKFSCIYPCTCADKNCSVDATKPSALGGTALAAVLAPKPVAAAKEDPPKVDPVPDAPTTVDQSKIDAAVFKGAAEKCRTLPNPSDTLFTSVRLVTAANACTSAASPPQPLLTDDTVDSVEEATKDKYTFQCRYLCTCSLLRQYKPGAPGSTPICMPGAVDPDPKKFVRLVGKNGKKVVLAGEGTGSTELGTAPKKVAPFTEEPALELKPAYSSKAVAKSYAEVSKKVDYYRGDTDYLLGRGDKKALCNSDNKNLADPEKKIEAVYFSWACLGKKDGDKTEVTDPRSAEDLVTKSPNGSYRYTCSPTAICRKGKAIIKPGKLTDADYGFDVSFPYDGVCQKIMPAPRMICQKGKTNEMAFPLKGGTVCKYSCFCNDDTSPSLCDLKSIKK